MFFLYQLKQTGYRYQSKAIKSSLVSFCILAIHSLTFGQTTYYVAGNGNDGNNGTTVNTPFQTLAKVSSLPLQAGDSVLFRRGDTFRGTLSIRQSGLTNRNIVYAAYGSGAKPVLAGSVPVTNWTNIGGNVWQANCPSCGSSVTGLYRNGVSLPLGRYPNADAPNKGYLTIRAHTNNYQIFSVEPLPDNIDFNGAEVVMRPTQWIIDRAVIDHEYHPDVLNINYSSNYSLTDGWGYFIQSHPGTLDQNGEWYYDPTTKNIVVFDTQGTIGSQLVTATVNSRGVDMAYNSNVVLRNLTITETLNEAITTTNVSNFTLVNSDVTNSGEDGINIRGYGTNVWLENNRIADVNNNGVYTDGIQSFTFRGNTLRRVGMVPGRGKGGDGQYNGIQSNANQNVLIENNVIDSIGYNGIQFWNNTTIRQNVISNYCMTKSDGGALYAFNSQKAAMTNIHILSNIIYNGIGAPEGSFRKEYSGANGIFLDDCVTNVELNGNTVFNNHQWGIYLHATSFITAVGNTAFNNGVSQFVMYHDAGYCPIRSNIVNNNIFVTKDLGQLAGQYESNADDLVQYGAIDSNYYARPFTEEQAILGYKNTGQGGGLSLKDWNTFSGGLDLHSKSSPVTYKQYKSDGAAGGVNRINSSFDTDLGGWYLVYSDYNNAEAALDNTNKLDGNSLRVSFPTPSNQTGSYAQAGIRFGAITKGKTYVLRFDAIASVPLNILAYLRTSGPPYQEYDRRYTVAMSTTRTSYEFIFTASDSNPDAILLFQIDGEGPVFWLDNIRMQEGIDLINDPNDLIKFYYNPTFKDSVIVLKDTYRDMKSKFYSGSVTLKPFTSVVLLKDTPLASPADLSIALQSDRRVVPVNQTTTLRLRVINQSTTPAALARWTYRLPANMQFIDGNGQPYSDNVTTGTVQQLGPLADTTFLLSVKPTASGLYRMAAQLTTAISPDPDSTPNSGTADGEDDASVIELEVGVPFNNLFESPNPNQRILPAVASSQPTPVAGKADLSLRMEVNRRTPALNDVITCTLYVNNMGGTDATSVQLQNLLPTGFQLVNSGNWTANGQTLTASIGAVAAGATVSSSFQVRVTSVGVWTNQAQVSASDVADPDSTPGNGYTNGEDDRAQMDVRVH